MMDVQNEPRRGIGTQLPTPPATEILRCEVGSTLHGIGIGSDDVDLMSVAIEPRRAVTGMGTWEHWTWRTAAEGERSGPGDVDWTVYGLRKYLRLAMQGNPSVICLLYAPLSFCEYLHPAGAELTTMRDYIVSQKCIPRFLGYLHGQRERALNGMGSGRGAREGRSAKWASHMVRLGFQANEIITRGVLTLPMPSDQAETCRRVKRGELPFGEALDLAAALESDARAASPVIRREPDVERVEDWVHGVYLREWRHREEAA